MKLRVLALSYLFPNSAQPGYGIFVLNRLRAVHEFCDLKVIAPIQWYPFIARVRGALWGERIPRHEKIGGLDVYHPRFPVIPRYLKWIDAITYWLSVRGLVHKLKNEQGFDFDVIDVHWTYPDVVAGYLLSRRWGKKFIVTVRGHEALYEDERSIRRWLVGYFLRQADGVVALSDELYEKLLQLGVERNRVTVVLNGVDGARFRPMERNACRKQLGLPQDARIIISVGRVTAGKGHQDLVRILPEVLKDGRAELYIIGGVNPEDDFTRNLKSQITEMNLDTVHLMDKVPHEMLPLWYGAADLFCLATRREGCPNVLLESLACGTPVVVTDVGAVDQMVVPGENGFRVKLDDVPTFAKAVRESLKRHWDRQKISTSMRNWTWAGCAQKIMALYQSVLARN